MESYTNCRIFCNGEIRSGLAVITENGRITDICAENDAKGERVDLGGRILSPGFIDLQVNGGGGILFNENPERLAEIYNAHRSCGTAVICPTVITDDLSVVERAARAVAAADKRVIPTLHIEGFFVSPEKKGIHDSKFMLKPNKENLQRIASIGECRCFYTLAPEVFSDIDGCLRVLSGSAVFCGHTNCTAAEYDAFLRAGGRGSTHLFNAMSGMTARNSGAIGATLASDTAYAGIIADGRHVDYAAVKAAYRAMKGRLFLVSDAMPPACSDITEYELYGRHIRVENGVCVDDGGTIAGSCLCMLQAVKNCVEHCHIPICDALSMASEIPARAIGLDGYGRIEVGAEAIFTVFDEDLEKSFVL